MDRFRKIIKIFFGVVIAYISLFIFGLWIFAFALGIGSPTGFSGAFRQTPFEVLFFFILPIGPVLLTRWYWKKYIPRKIGFIILSLYILFTVIVQHFWRNYVE